MKETLRDRVRAHLAANPDQTRRQVAQALDVPLGALRLAVEGMRLQGEVVSTFTGSDKGRAADRTTLRLVHVHVPAKATSTHVTSNLEALDAAPTTAQPFAFVRGRASFACARRGQEVTHADCYDDHLDAEAYERKSSPCYHCKEGAAKREAYAQA